MRSSVVPSRRLAGGFVLRILVVWFWMILGFALPVRCSVGGDGASPAWCHDDSGVALSDSLCLCGNSVLPGVRGGLKAAPPARCPCASFASQPARSSLVCCSQGFPLGGEVPKVFGQLAKYGSTLSCTLKGGDQDQAPSDPEETVTPELVCYLPILNIFGWDGGSGELTRPHGSHQGTTVCVRTLIAMEQQSDHKLKTAGEMPSGVNLNRYARLGSHISWPQ